jgi:hypothetical protein
MKAFSQQININDPVRAMSEQWMQAFNAYLHKYQVNETDRDGFS